jgi:hypothetical protein
MTLPWLVEETIPIENCLKWQLKCPIAHSLLKRTDDPKKDYCGECKEQ